MNGRRSLCAEAVQRVGLVPAAVLAACMATAPSPGRIGTAASGDARAADPSVSHRRAPPAAVPPLPSATARQHAESSHVDDSPAGPAAAGATRVEAGPPGSHVMPDVDYWATPQPVVDRMLELARVKATDLVYDLGCGDARSLVTAAERYGARGVGFDIDPDVVALARDNVRRHRVEELVRIEEANIFTLDLSPADVVFLYLTPRLNWRLAPQLEKLRRGSRIVLHEYEIPGARPLRIVKMRGPPDGPPGTEEEPRIVTHTLYLWKVPWQKQPTDWTEADRATDPDQAR
jgi:SAM-dependent methyltransferase